MLAASEPRFRPHVVAPKVYLRPAVRDDIPALSSLLQNVFRVPSSAMLVDRHHLAWKYWSTREDWTGPRSFAAQHDGRIVAHVAAWPVRILLPGEVLSGAHLIDWVSDPRYPGAGLWLIRQMESRIPLLIATGGTEVTRRMLPVTGFRPFGEICSFARPLRPFAQSGVGALTNWRQAGRLVRNSAWRCLAPVSAPPGWSAAPIRPEEIDDSIWPSASEKMAVAARDAAFYRYLFASPLTRYALFGVRRRGALAGYFCLAYARHVARIADVWVASSHLDDWCAAFRTACGIAARTCDVHEVTAWASTTIAKNALARAGFRVRDKATLSLFGNAASLAGRALHIQMLDCDASFLAADEVRYLT